MIISDNKKYYQECKEEVLKLYGYYIDFCKKYDDNNTNISIDKESEKIKNEEFNILILGEAKSGKSTLINAYLGKEVLPMDVLQCTSAIIKIRRGDEFKLMDTKANGSKEEIEGEEEIKNFLEKHASIDDKYRQIPAHSINMELLIDKKGKIYEKDIEEFLNRHKEDNIYNIDNYEKLIKEYINDKKDKWEDIITEINIIYKLPEEMQGITVIDSPGINDGGDVGAITEKNIERSDAIIFVKSLSGQALESKSFMKLLKYDVPKKLEEFVFLVFTGKNKDINESEFKNLEKQAKELYKNDIEEEKIIFVDSKIQLFLNKCLELKTVEEIDKYFDEIDKKGEKFDKAENIWLKSKGNFNIFKEKMEESSNFQSFIDAIDKFGSKAQYLQLEAFLKALEKEYKLYESRYSDSYDTVKKTYKDPIELEKDIENKEKELDEISNKINNRVDSIQKKYEGIIEKEANKMIKEFKEKLDKFKNIPYSENTVGELKKISTDAIDSSKKFRRKIADNFISECNKELIEYANVKSSIISAKAYTPNFTESDFSDFEDINKEAIEKSIASSINKIASTTAKADNLTIYEILGFTALTTTIFMGNILYKNNNNKHVKIIVDRIERKFENKIIPNIITNLIDYINECSKLYKNKLNENINKLRVEHDKLLKYKDDNEKLEKEYKEKLDLIKENREKIEPIKKELENYVRKC